MNGRLKQCLLLMLSDVSDCDSLESSEDSDEEKIFHLAMDCLLTDKKRMIRNGAETRIEKYSDRQFLKNFGVEKILVVYLSNKFEHSSHYLSIIDRGKVSLSARNHIYVYLWFIKHLNMTYRAISRIFNISLSTVHITLQRVCLFLNDLAPAIIRWPGEEERIVSAENYFRTTGISGIIGCVGSTNMLTDQITTRIDKKSHVVPVQAVCNHENRFIDVFIGKNNFAVNNSLFEQSGLENKLIKLKEDEHIIGSSEYPGLQNLIVPISTQFALDETQLEYNNKLNASTEQTKVCLENIKEQFQQLKCMRVRNIKLQYLIIKSAFVLYNLCSKDVENVNPDHDYSLNYNLLEVLINDD